MRRLLCWERVVWTWRPHFRWTSDSPLPTHQAYPTLHHCRGGHGPRPPDGDAGQVGARSVPARADRGRRGVRADRARTWWIIDHAAQAQPRGRRHGACGGGTAAWRKPSRWRWRLLSDAMSPIRSSVAHASARSRIDATCAMCCATSRKSAPCSTTPRWHVCSNRCLTWVRQTPSSNASFRITESTAHGESIHAVRRTRRYTTSLPV